MKPLALALLLLLVAAPAFAGPPSPCGWTFGDEAFATVDNPNEKR